MCGPAKSENVGLERWRERGSEVHDIPSREAERRLGRQEPQRSSSEGASLQATPRVPESPLHPGTGTLGQPCSSPEALSSSCQCLAVSDPCLAPEQRLALRWCQERPPCYSNQVTPALPGKLCREIGQWGGRLLPTLPPVSKEAPWPRTSSCVCSGGLHVCASK